LATKIHISAKIHNFGSQVFVMIDGELDMP
jgi:hypothetical protein